MSRIIDIRCTATYNGLRCMYVDGHAHAHSAADKGNGYTCSWPLAPDTRAAELSTKLEVLGTSNITPTQRVEGIEALRGLLVGINESSWNEWHAEYEEALRAKCEELSTTLKRVQSAAKTGMDAAKAISSAQLEAARRLFAESSPAALESQRAANEQLTTELEELSAKFQTAVAEDLSDEVLIEEALAPLGALLLDPPDGGDVTLVEQVRRLVTAHLELRAACVALLAANDRFDRVDATQAIRELVE